MINYKVYSVKCVGGDKLSALVPSLNRFFSLLSI